MGHIKFTVILVMLFSSQLSLAATPCSKIKDDAKRLECFDSVNKKTAPKNKGNPEESAAQKAVLGSLKDPDSAKFGKFTQVADSACLTVNAKNSMGGYTGDQQAYLMKIENQWAVVSIESKINHDQCIEAATQMNASKAN